MLFLLPNINSPEKNWKKVQVFSFKKIILSPFKVHTARKQEK